MCIEIVTLVLRYLLLDCMKTQAENPEQMSYDFLLTGGVHRVSESEGQHRDGPEGTAGHHQDHRPLCSNLPHRQRVHHRAQLPH